MKTRTRSINDVRQARKRGDFDFVLSALSDPDDLVAEIAARSLGLLGDLRAVEPLLARLPAGDNGYRILVTRALVRLGDPRAVPSIYELAAAENLNWSVRANAAKALGELGDRRGIPFVAEILVRSEGVSAELENRIDHTRLFHYKLSKRWAARTLIEQRGIEAIPILDSAPRDSLGWRERLRLSMTIRRLRALARRAKKRGRTSAAEASRR